MFYHQPYIAPMDRFKKNIQSFSRCFHFFHCLMSRFHQVWHRPLMLFLRCRHAAYAVFVFFSCALAPVTLHSTPLDFHTFRLGDGKDAVLVVGGIQGDEPGGFSAATLLATRYDIESGALWVVPNLNFPSIIKRSRGVHGDMNRKFAILDKTDPEYATVRRIQDLIDDPQVGLILNLHDGSGYYRPSYQDKLKNPARWGQSIIIDQERLDTDGHMADLAGHAEHVAKKVNASLLKDIESIHVHNTRTAEGDREMEKSLSYYAVRHNKAAFGLEASKELSVAQRTYYHLCMIEEFLRLANIRFSRDFELTPRGIEKALREGLGISFADNRIFLPLENARQTINYLPLPREFSDGVILSKPIMAILPCENNRSQLCVHYGNRKLSVIKPDWRNVEKTLDSVRVLADGSEKEVFFGQIVDVALEARILGQPGYRVNAIGFDSGKADESDLALRRKDFEKKYSVDRAATLFRVEVYKGKNIAGLFLLRFVDAPVARKSKNRGN